MTLVFGAPDRTGSTGGRSRPAPWNPRSGFEGEGANRGDVSRPEQSGGRVTTTERILIARGRLSPTKEAAGGQQATLAQEGGASAFSCGRGADCASAGEPVRPRATRSRREWARALIIRRAEAVSAQRLSADGPEHQTEAAEWSVRGFMRSRSRPQRPRTGSPNAVRSAGTGQRKSTKCRRGGPVAAQRSSGLPRRQGGSPTGADGRGKPGGRKGGAQPGPDGRWRPRGRAGDKGAAGGAPSRQGATPRRDPGDCNAGRLLLRSVERRSSTNRTGKPRICGLERKHRAKISKGGAGPWGRGKGRQRPCPSAEGKDAGAVTGLEQRNALARPLPTALWGGGREIPLRGMTGGKGKKCKGRDGHLSGRREPCLPII